MQSQIDDETRGLALYNSDTDDWTLVSPPSSHSSLSPDSSPERGSSRPTEAGGTVNPTESSMNEKSFPQISALDDPVQSCSRIEPPPTRRQARALSVIREEKSAQEGRKDGKSRKMLVNLAGASTSERANDADDESDGMTEINLDENGLACIQEQAPGGGAQSDAGSSDEWTDDLGRDESMSKSGLGSDLFNLMAIYGNKGKATELVRRQNETSIETRSRKIRTVPKSGEAIETSTEILSRDQDQDQNQLSHLTARRLTDLIDRLEPFLLGFILVCSLLFIISCILAPRDSSFHPQRTPRRLYNSTFDFLYSDPSNHAYTELKILNEDIADCIERENPVMRELAHWRSMDPKELSKYKTITNLRPFKGLVCYENEVKWRKRFNFLKTEFNYDLRKIVRQIKRRLTNDILVSYNPNTQFELVLNQLEYLDHVEQRRKDRALERLKAENLDLLRRLNERVASEQERQRNYNKSQYSKQHNNQNQNNNHHQQGRHSESTSNKQNDHTSIKSLIILESENVRLRREVESLKSRLAEKAGTIYIKQSIELEKCERENIALKQFHLDIADDIDSNLVKVGLQQAETSTHMTTNEEDSIGRRLASTRDSFGRLGDEITKLIEHNEIIEKDLSEAKRLRALAIREARDLIEDANKTKHSVIEQPERFCQTKSSNIHKYKKWNQKGAKQKAPLPPMPLPMGPISEPEIRQYPLTNLPENQKHNNGRSTHAIINENIARKHIKLQHDSHHKQYKKLHDDITNEHKRLSSLKKLNKANAYNENSRNNCKNHLRRDEF